MNNKYIIFDLDDTLVSEIDYLESAFREIAILINKEDSDGLYSEMLKLRSENNNVFNVLISQYPHLFKNDLLKIYRNHFPEIKFKEGAEDLLSWCNEQQYKIGLITDGRSITQRNKLKALGIENLFDKMVISEEFGSEKPAQENFTVFHTEGIMQYYYVADNIRKDFITPNALGWITICLKDDGRNIHPQSFDVEKEYLPQYLVDQLSDIKAIIETV